MIQLSNTLSMNPETPVKTAGAGIADGGFANLLAGELESDPAAGGKGLPGALPAGGKNLPGAMLAELPGDLPATLPAQSPVAAEGATTPDETAGKALPIGAIVIPSIRLAAANQEPLLPDQAAAEPKTEAPRAETLPLLAAKAVAAELKARTRAERPAAEEAIGKPADPEVADAEADAEEIAADGPKGRPVMAGEVTLETPAALIAAPLAATTEQMEPIAVNVPAPEEQPAAGSHAEPARAETKRGELPQPSPGNAALSDQAGEAAEAPAPKEGVRQTAERDTSAKGDGAKGERSAPELRFEFSRASSERAATTAANQAGQIRMPLAAASQIVVGEGAISGAVADASTLQGASNQASTSFASQQGVRPHDFTALVDRLVEARETARGGSVNVAVMHADFGEVSLRFRQDGNGLSVSMSNSDPEFARAVSAASQAEGGHMGDNSGQGSRRDESNQAGNAFSRSGAGGDWGQSSADAQMGGGGRQHMQDDPRGDQLTAQARTASGEERSGKDGIYA